MSTHTSASAAIIEELCSFRSWLTGPQLQSVCAEEHQHVDPELRVVHTLLSTKLVSDDAKILRLCWHAIHLAAVGLVARWITPEKRLVEIKANLRDVRYLTSDRSATRFSARSRSKDPANHGDRKRISESGLQMWLSDCYDGPIPPIGRAIDEEPRRCALEPRNRLCQMNASLNSSSMSFSVHSRVGNACKNINIS